MKMYTWLCYAIVCFCHNVCIPGSHMWIDIYAKCVLFICHRLWTQKHLGFSICKIDLKTWSESDGTTVEQTVELVLICYVAMHVI